MKRKSLLFGFMATLIIVAAIPRYDTDDTFRAVQWRYGDDIAERTCHEPCETDGIGIELTYFGAKAIHCKTTWFVLFNLLPFQISGPPMS